MVVVAELSPAQLVDTQRLVCHTACSHIINCVYFLIRQIGVYARHTEGSVCHTACSYHRSVVSRDEY